MKILVVYMSPTGNTKKVAESIFKEITETKHIMNLSAINSLDDYDFTFIGFPIHAFGPVKEGKEFLEKKARGKKVALFVTHGVHEKHKNLNKWLGRCRAAAAGAKLAGMFNCQGEVAPEILESLGKGGDSDLLSLCNSTDQSRGQPDENRLIKARAFACEMIEIIKGEKIGGRTYHGFQVNKTGATTQRDV